VAGALVVAAGSFRGGRLVRSDLPPSIVANADGIVDPEHKLRIVLDGMTDDSLIAELCERNHMTEADYHGWRETALAGATRALSSTPLIEA
jgi:hypothetical protein